MRFHCVNMRRMVTNSFSQAVEMWQRQYSHVGRSITSNVSWKMKNLSFVQRPFWQNLHSHFGNTDIKYGDIYTHTSTGNIISATVTMFKMPFQPDRWHHGNITVEMFIDHLQNCSCPAIAFLQHYYNIYLVNAKIQQLKVVKPDVGTLVDMTLRIGLLVWFLRLLKMSVHVHRFSIM